MFKLWQRCRFRLVSPTNLWVYDVIYPLPISLLTTWCYVLSLFWVCARRGAAGPLNPKPGIRGAELLAEIRLSGTILCGVGVDVWVLRKEHLLNPARPGREQR